ncbi:hypothetical protein [Streptomyces showdoensis]|uniref:Uncharacterized protein n=1 Tax=Streptomyces showdoensis TaxID=68268 RepID=A0A2P2GNR7_STREW|nr:hypothetical protein [Streptomyces showdoensis]KKZ73124.1 hypothetical protein VO63_14695 [Streptomyces showdoensis]
MTSQAGGSHTGNTFRDRVEALLRGPGPLDKLALIDTLDAEASALEIRAYTAGWTDALAELRRVSR